MAPAVKVVIPARLGSVRMRDKPLADILGKPMVVHTYEVAAEAVGAEHVIVATDSIRVVEAIEEAGGKALVTDREHASGTDRVAEVAAREGWAEDTVVVNLQGDEPMMPPSLVQQVADVLLETPDADMATLATPIRRADDLTDPNIVKLVVDKTGRALYFSRATIPYVRDLPVVRDPAVAPYLRHIGLYGYRVGALRRLAGMAPVPLEEAEKLEQLRALYAGMHLQVAVTKKVPHHGVDTAEMLAAVTRAMAARLKDG